VEQLVAAKVLSPSKPGCVVHCCKCHHQLTCFLLGCVCWVCVLGVCVGCVC
jgi:hypothetical protein